MTPEITPGQVHVMLDLETMGNNPQAPIMSIGAVANIFDGEGKWVELSEFSVAVSLESAVQAGAKIDPDTVLWWLQQSDSARSALIQSADKTVDLYVALEYLDNWLGVYDKPLIWGNGVDFDNMIVTQSAELVGLPPLWSYRQNRCFRTLKNMFGTSVPEPARFVESCHIATEDARHQAKWLGEILYHLKSLHAL